MNIYFGAFSAGVIILYCTGVLLPLCDEFLIGLICVALLAICLCFSAKGSRCLLGFVLHANTAPRSPAQRRSSYLNIKIACLVCALAVIGYCYASLAARSTIEHSIKPEHERTELTVAGYVCDLPRLSEHYFSVHFCVVRAFPQSKDSPGKEPDSDESEYKVQLKKLALSAPIEYLDDLMKRPISIKVRLKAPRSTLNFVGGSAEQYFFSRELGARAWLLGSLSSLDGWDSHAVRFSTAQKIEFSMLAWRWRLLRHINDQVSNFEHRGALTALAMGYRGYLSEAENLVLQSSGLQHLMAISGLHVGLVVLLLTRFVRGGSVGAIAIVAVLSLFYAVLVGLPASAQRAWVMAVLALFVVHGYFKMTWWRAYWLALALVLVWDPLAPLTLGFWYSFLAVGLVLIGLHLKWWQGLGVLPALVLMQALFFLFLAPVNAWFGMPHSLAMLAANTIAIPLISLFVLPCIIFAMLVSWSFPDISVWLFASANEVVYLVFALSQEFVTHFPSVKTLGWNTPELAVAWLAYLATFALVLILGRRFLLSWVMLCVLCLYLLAPSKRIKAVEPMLTVMDVGQGLSLILNDDKEVWIYDLGPKFNQSSSYRRALLPTLNSRHYPLRIEGAILSHADADHVGDVTNFLSERVPSRVITGEKDRLTAMIEAEQVRAGRRQGLDVRQIESCFAGMKHIGSSVEQGYRRTSSLSWRVLYPYAEAEGGLVSTPNFSSAPLSSNNRSCVVMFELGDLRVLVMGDMEGRAERNWLKYMNERADSESQHYVDSSLSLKADVLIAGHHGSRFATSYALLKQVSPSYVVFSAGYANRFGHPSSEVIERAENLGLKTSGFKTLNTAEQGAMTFQMVKPNDLEHSTIELRSARDERSAFWLWPYPDLQQ